MNIEVAAYTAGIIDGEGYIVITKQQGHKGKPSHILKVEVGNTSRPLLDWLQAQWGGSITPFNSPSYQQRSPKPFWAWKLYGPKAGALLQVVLSFLIIKTQQAELAIEFLEQRTLCLGEKLLSEQEIELRDAYRDAIRVVGCER